MKQNDEFLITLLKYLDERNSDIKNVNEVNILSSQ